MLGVVSRARVGNSTGTLDGLAAQRSSAKGIVGFMVMVLAVRPLLIDIKRAIGEWLLNDKISANQETLKIAYMTRIAIEAPLVVLALELPIRRVDSLRFNREAALSTLETR